jgi:hypothetical protein
MKYEAANHVEPGKLHKLTDFIRRNPDMSDAAKSGTPTWIRRCAKFRLPCRHCRRCPGRFRAM